MSPLRIIILVILFYIAYRLFFKARKPAATARRGRSHPADIPLSDTLEEDPVCKKLVPSRQAVQFEWQGKKLYFCSQECCNTFRTNQGD